MKKYLILLILCTLLFTGCGENYSNGNRAGTIIKFSERGIFVKSYEGEMLLGSYMSDQNGMLVPEKFYFSIPKNMYNEELIEKINKCTMTGKRCQLFYEEDFIRNPFVVDTGYYIVNAKMLED